MPVLLVYLSKLLISAKPALKIPLSALTTFGKLMLLKMPRLRIYALVLILLTSGIVGYRIGLTSAETQQAKTSVVTRFQPIPDVKYYCPAIPECGGFDFDGDVGGMPLNEYIEWGARLYKWSAACSNAQFEAENKLNDGD